MTQLADKFRAARAYYVCSIVCLKLRVRGFYILLCVQTEPQLTSEVEDCDKETEGLKERGM